MKMRRRLAAAAGLALALLWVGRARAEVVELLDGSKMFGTLLHYYDGLFTFRVSGGTLVKIPADKVKAIRFKLPKPRPALSTPAKTFWRQRKAFLRGDLQTFVDCYSLQYQTLLMHQLGAMPAEQLLAMKRQLEHVKFRIRSTRYKGNMAFLELSQSDGKNSATVTLQFVKENGEWKMVMPAGMLPAGPSAGGSGR